MPQQISDSEWASLFARVAVSETNIQRDRIWAETRINDLENLILTKLEHNEKAVELASEALTIRLDHANGLIQQMKEQAATFIQRVEYVALDARLDAAEKTLHESSGKYIGSQPIRDILMVAAGVVVTYLVTQFLSK